MLVIGAVVLLLWASGLATPVYKQHILRAKAIVLKQNLAVMRQAIVTYTATHNRSPQGLNDLVESGLLPRIPKDPITGSIDTWQFDRDSALLRGGSNSGIKNVRSGAVGLGTYGVPYSHY